MSVKSDLGEEDRCYIQGNFYEYRKTISLDTFETSFKIKHKISKSSLTIKRLKLSKAKSFKFIGKRKISTIKRLNIEKRKNEKLTDIKSAFIFNVLDVSDSKDEESKKNTFIEIIRKLRQQLRQAKEKVIYLITTLSAVHEVIESLIVRTSRASTLLKTAVKLQSFLNISQQEVINKEGQLREMKKFYRINVKNVRDLTRSGDNVVARLYANFLSLSNRLFYHNEKSTLDLRI